MRQMDARKMRTIGMTDYISIHTHPAADPKHRDEYMLNAEMNFNSLMRLTEDKTYSKGLV